MRRLWRLLEDEGMAVLRGGSLWSDEALGRAQAAIIADLGLLGCALDERDMSVLMPSRLPLWGLPTPDALDFNEWTSRTRRRLDSAALPHRPPFSEVGAATKCPAHALVRRVERRLAGCAGCVVQPDRFCGAVLRLL